MWIQALIRARQTIRQIKDRIIQVDKTDEDVFVLLGNHWLLVNKQSVNIGRAGLTSTLFSAQLKSDERAKGLAALIGRATGKITRNWVYVSPPGPYAVRVGFERSGETLPDAHRVFGFIRRDEHEGLYFGKWTVEYGDPDQQKLLFGLKDEGHENEV
jgi:hypothetical protein